MCSRKKILPAFKELPWNDKVISDNTQGCNQENNLKMILMFIIKIYDILYIEKMILRIMKKCQGIGLGHNRCLL